MKRTRRAPLLANAATALLLMLSGSSGVAQDKPAVVELRTPTVALYDQPNGMEVKRYSREEFKGKPQWKVIDGPKEGHLKVEVDGTPYWVRLSAVVTNKRTVADAECGVVVTEPRAATVRGLGEGCRK